MNGENSNENGRLNSEQQATMQMENPANQQQTLQEEKERNRQQVQQFGHQDCKQRNYPKGNDAKEAEESEDVAESPTASQLCLDCLRKSSVRGLPRILASKGAHLKALWCLAVAAFLICLLYNLAALTIAYQRGDIIITERPDLPRPQFPSVTVCDASPIPSSAMDQLSVSPMTYRAGILASGKFNPAKDRDQEEDATEGSRTMLLRELLNPQTYFDHLNAELSNLTRMHNDSLVLTDSCHAHTEVAGRHLIQRCSRVRRTIVPGYFYCSTIDTGVQLDEKISFHVLLDSEEDSLECRHCVPEHTETMRTGAILFVHERSTYPVLVNAGLFLTPGTQSYVFVKSKQISLPEHCSNVHPDVLNFDFFGSRHTSSYYQALCQSLARHELIAQRCGCFDASIPRRVPSSKEEQDGEDGEGNSRRLPSCAARVLGGSGDDPDLFKGVECIMKVDQLLSRGDGVVNAEDASIDIGKRCPKPCTYLDFTTVRSATRGVTKNTALEIYRTLVANTSAYERSKHHLQPYEEALRLKAANRLEEARQVMARADYLEQNFLTVTVWFPDGMSTRVMHQFVVTLENYVSQVGGLLSLFSGITVVCIAELLELMLNLACRYGRCRKRNSSRRHSSVA